MDHTIRVRGVDHRVCWIAKCGDEALEPIEEVEIPNDDFILTCPRCGEQYSATWDCRYLNI